MRSILELLELLELLERRFDEEIECAECLYVCHSLHE